MQSKWQQDAVRLTFHQLSPWASCKIIFCKQSRYNKHHVAKPCSTPVYLIFEYFQMFSTTFSTPKTLFQHHHRSCLEIISAWRTLGVRFARFGNPAGATHGTKIVPKVKKDLTGNSWAPDHALALNNIERWSVTYLQQVVALCLQ